MKKILAILFFVIITNVFANSNNNNEKVLILASINKNAKNVDYKIKYTIISLLKNIKYKNKLVIKLSHKNKYYIILYKTKDYQEYKNFIKKYKAIPIKNHKELKDYLLLKISEKNKVSKINLTQSFINDLYLNLKKKFDKKTAKKMLDNYLNCYQSLKIIDKNFLINKKNCNFIFPLKIENKLDTINFKQKVIKVFPTFEVFLKRKKMKQTKKDFKQISIKHQQKKVIELKQNPFFVIEKKQKKEENKTIRNEISKKVNGKEKNISTMKQHSINKNTLKNNFQDKNYSLINNIFNQSDNKKENIKNNTNNIKSSLKNKNTTKQSKKIELASKQKNNNVKNINTNVITTNKFYYFPKKRNNKKNLQALLDKNNHTFLYGIIGIMLIILAYFINIYYKIKNNTEKEHDDIVQNIKIENKNKELIEKNNNQNVDENIEKQKKNKTNTKSTTSFVEEKKEIENIIIKAGKYTHIKKLKNLIKEK